MAEDTANSKQRLEAATRRSGTPLTRIARGRLAELLVLFPTDPGWAVVSVPGRLHPTFTLIAVISLLDAGSLLAHKRRLLLDWAIFWGCALLGGALGGAGFAERLALAVVGALLFLGARRSR